MLGVQGRDSECEGLPDGAVDIKPDDVDTKGNFGGLPSILYLRTQQSGCFRSSQLFQIGVIVHALPAQGADWLWNPWRENSGQSISAFYCHFSTNEAPLSVHKGRYPNPVEAAAKHSSPACFSTPSCVCLHCFDILISL